MHVTIAALFLCALGTAAVRGQGSGVNCTRSGVTSTRPSPCYEACPCPLCPTCPPGFTATYRPSFPPSWHRHLNDSALFGNWTSSWYRVLDLSSFGILSIAPHVLQQLPTGSCVEEVRLEHNNLTAIQDGVFSGLRLRFVNLSHNAIEDMGPEVFDTQSRENCLQFVDVSHNALAYMDTWPYYDASISFLELFDLAHNRIGSFRNSRNFSFDVYAKRVDCVSCRTAVFDLQWNNFSTADSLLGSTGLRVLRPDLNIPFDLGYFNLSVEHNDWFCDCHFFALRKSLDRNFLPTQNMATFVPLIPRCQSPHALQNQSLRDVEPDQLVCNISTAAACPPQCLCQKVPARETILVKCSGLSSLPSALPEDELPLTLNLAGNRISALEPRSYLHRVKALDLRSNGLRTVSDSAVKTLQRTLQSLDLRHNDLSALPSSLAALTASSVDLRFNSKLQCSCSLQWLADWSHWNLTCLHGNRQVDLASMATALDCANRLVVPIAASLAVLVALVVGMAVLYRVWLRKRLAKWSFRMCRQVYPALTPRRAQPDAGQGQDVGQPEFDRLNDVYVSLDDDDEEVRHWVVGTLLPALEREAPAMTVYLRCRDARFANDVADEIHAGLQASRRLLVVLSRRYSDASKYCLYELDAWVGGAGDRGATPVLLLFHGAEQCGVRSQVLQRLLLGETVFRRQDRHCLTDVKFALRR